MRFSNTNADNPLITKAENSAIAEIEATASTCNSSAALLR